MRLFGSTIVALLSIYVMTGTAIHPAFGMTNIAEAQDSGVQLMSAEELKTKLDKNEPVTIIDVRATSSYAESDNKIKGAIHVKLRRLKSRLSYAPLKNVSKDAEIVTYCACPSDESSVRAAQILKEAGFKQVRALQGGWEAWLAVKGPVQMRPKTP